MARNITKKDLVDGIVSRTGMHREHISKVVAEFLEAIKSHLARHERIELREFGVFSVRHREGHPARNPRTGEPAPVPERYAPVFKFSPIVRDGVSSGRK